MGAFFEPASIAVVGASADPARGGHRILRNLLDRFQGPVYAINPNLDEVLGVRAYPSIAAVVGSIDLAVVFIPAAGTPDVVRDCVAKRVKAVCIESGGFADAGMDGLRLQRELDGIVQGTATRLWGPNCAGYVSTVPPLSTSFVVTPGDLTPGNVSIVAQSGMMAAALLVQIFSESLFTVSKACSIGNECDIDESDLLEYLAEDQQTEVIALYLEGIQDGRRFLDRCSQRANVVALMGGVTETGAVAALSHTGSVASEQALVAAALRQKGVLEVHDFMDLVEVAAGLSVLGHRRAGPRVGVLTCSGAAGVVSSDLFDRAGLSLAQLAPTTLDRLAAIFPPWFPPANPVDIWSTVERVGPATTLAETLRALVDDDGVDSVLLTPLAFEFFDVEELDPMLEVAARSAKPIVAWPLGARHQLDAWASRFADAGIPACRSLAIACQLLQALATRDRAVRSAEAVQRRGARLAGERVRHWAAIALRPGPGVGEIETKRVLAAYGIVVVEERQVSSAEDAVAAAGDVGYPLVLKLADDTATHKTELGAVRLNIRSEDELSSAAGQLLALAERERLADPVLLVQPMVPPGLELIVGARRDPSFGPVVIVGIGGILVEQIGDTAVRPAPINEAEARDMLTELRSTALLAGGRGRPPVDVAAIVDAMLAMSDAITDAPPRVQAIEANPLIVGAVGEGARAVDGLIVLTLVP